MARVGRRVAGIAGTAVLLAVIAVAQHSHEDAPPPPERSGPLRPAMLLLRQSKTAEARKLLQELVKANPSDAELHYQIARSHLIDFYRQRDSAQARVSLGLAMEELQNTLKRNPDHIPALRAKAVIHARAELLFYDPNLAYELGSRVAKLQPHANEYLLTLTDWMSGEVRFTQESGHRVPHDPLLGLDRSIEILERIVDECMPRSNEETLALFAMGKTLAKRGNFRQSVEFFKLLLDRPTSKEQRADVLRELGVSYFRMGEFGDAARTFYEAWQAEPGNINKWLLKTALDRWKDDPPPIPEAARFETAPPEPGSPFAFTDVAHELGVDRFDGNGTCAWADYDDDGDMDLALAGSGTFMALYQNDGGKFKDVTAEVGLAGVPSGYSLNFVDYDNDGRIDLYISLNGWSGPMPNRLYRNEGGHFRDVSKQSGAADPGSGFVSVWGDLDNDGFLDFVVANGVLQDGSTPQVYHNNGDGTFANVTRSAGIQEPPTYGAIGAALGDYDRDGDLDILVNGRESAPDRLYRNDGKMRFTEVSRSVGVTQPPHNGFVCFFFDYNNDGWPDILTTSLAPWDVVVDALRRAFTPPGPKNVHPDAPRLFRNNRNGSFTDVTFEAKLYYPMGVMGSGVADLDNDGRIDIYFGTGDPQLSRLEPNRFFHNRGDGTFVDRSAQVGFARPGAKGHGVSFVDIDNDGDLDVYAQLGGHYPGDHTTNSFYRNLNGNRNNWLQLELAGVRSNRFAIGAELVLHAGDLTLYREIKGSEGFGSTDPYRVHFGLGRRERVDSIEIRWPSGMRQTLTDLAVNRRIDVREPER